MCTITATEFKQHFGKYMKLAQKEQIEVTHRGNTIFRIIPEKEQLKKEWNEIFGCLPREAYLDKDIDRE